MTADRIQTLARQLAASAGRPSGFDYLRLLLAVAVVASHTANVALGRDATMALWATPARPFLAAILPMFFALSGFLVAGSLERCASLISFLGLRVLRIFPALIVETTLSAIILGALFSPLSWSEYYTNKEFWSYFWNMVGYVHFYLPGVFTNNPWGPAVNQQLWTLPYELECYLTLAGLVIIGLVVRPRLLLIAASLICAVSVLAGWSSEHHLTTVAGRLLVLSFVFGVGLYRLRDVVPFSGAAALVATVLGLAALQANGRFDILAMPLLTYTTVYLGLLNPPRMPLVFNGDYSYGIFLYGFPIQQSVAWYLGFHPWWLNLVIALPLTVVVAVVSWHFIEHRALKLRGALVRLEGAVLARFLRFGGPIGSRVHDLIGLTAMAAKPVARR